jgi:hypothetical protein
VSKKRREKQVIVPDAALAALATAGIRGGHCYLEYVLFRTGFCQGSKG